MSEFDLHSFFFSFNRSKSAGFDMITVSYLFRKFGPLKDILLFLLNGIIDTGVFPSALESVIVKHFFEGGNNHGDAKSYRPISIISGISQILEKHLLNIMVSFLDRYGLISPHQLAFISSSGTQTLLDKFGDFLFSSVENN